MARLKAPAATPKPRSGPRPEDYEDRRRCSCGAVYRVAWPNPDPRHCGILLCAATATWTQEQWDGRRRMAEALVAAGTELHQTTISDGWAPGFVMVPVELTPMDREALARGNPTPPVGAPC